MYLSLSQYLQAQFGERVQKIPLDAGLSCPNRDGTLGTGGCIYCDASGAGRGTAKHSSVGQQMARGMVGAGRRYGAKKFIAYFQSFSNTYAPMERLEALYTEALVTPDVVGLAVGTRPDCVDEACLALIKGVGTGRMVWMEYGLQSASEATLRRIHRGHTVADFVRAVLLTRRFRLPVCAHVIFGLPGETRTDMEETVRFLGELRVEGVKFHQLSVLKGTPLHALHDQGAYEPISREAYVDMVAWAIRHLPAETVIQRVVGDPPPEDIVAPEWGRDKLGTLALVRERFRAQTDLP